ncbi:ROK family protein [Mycetocola tolaasinivorans]|uniref:ROK family protein n=1 Tax=Mycetocola tolaasinivorans TaxID=76635 RepID=A0A3L7A588_9MICO|nr:ROK family protein [Mycetocola tolaasinivorans]RLP75493.1 ROK family protein [Mycetocola tolaasinivorans]
MRLGIDVGGTKTAAVILDDNDAVVAELIRPTGYGRDEVLASVVESSVELAGRVGITADRFDSIGIGIPGAVNSATGRVEHAVNLGLDGFELGTEAAAQLGTRVAVENDVNAAAVGAYRYVSSTGSDTALGTDGLAYLNLGTGLAAGIVLDGHLRRGSSGVAGEIGHIPVDATGVICSCGQRGCLETIASGSAIARQWPTTGTSPVHDMMAAAAAGDPVAGRIRALLFEGVATAVRILTLSVDVRTVVLGGGVTSLGEPLLSGVNEVLDGWAESSPFLASLRLGERIRVIPKNHPVAAVGAALIGVP